MIQKIFYIQLKEISSALLTFRGSVNNEIMRVLMIPQVTNLSIAYHFAIKR